MQVEKENVPVQTYLILFLKIIYEDLVFFPFVSRLQLHYIVYDHVVKVNTRSFVYC